jgi:hypothetical protein
MSPESGSNAHPPRRVTVTSPRMRTSRRSRQHLSSEIDAQTRLGQVYMTTLIRAQLRLGLLVLAVVGVLLLGLPLVFWLMPELRTVRTVGGIPLPWLVLGVFVHPALIGAAWFYVRQVERYEREFADMVNRS